MKQGIFDSVRKVVSEDNDFMPAPEAEVKPEITDELVSELIGGEDLDPDQVAKGLQVELEHYATVAKEMSVIMGIVKDHLAESPKYYDYLAEMEAKMAEEAETPQDEEEVIPEEEVEAPVEDEEPVGAADEGKVPTKRDDSEATRKELLEVNIVPKGVYAVSDKGGKASGEKIQLDVAEEGSVVSKEGNKKVIQLNKGKNYIVIGD